METRRDLFEFMQTIEGDSSTKIQYVQNNINKVFKCDQYSDEILDSIKQAIYRVCSELFKRWKKSSRTKVIFYKNNSEWLKKTIYEVSKNSTKTTELPSTSKGSRPEISFELCSERLKRRKTEIFRTHISKSELTYAASMSLRSLGEEDAAKLLKESTNTTPTRASKIRQCWENKKKKINVTRMNEDKALSLLVNAKLSKHQYQLIRSNAKENDSDIYPPYNLIREAKTRCYPPKETFKITETLAEINLQELLDHTVFRIIQCQWSVVDSFSVENITSMVLITKWGFDGSTGHSEYKQICTEDFDDSKILLTSLVPIQLFINTSHSNKQIIWKNPRPSSTRYCRPIRVQFKKETTEVNLNEKEYIENQIKELKSTKLSINNYNLDISHAMQLTMIDGKVCNAITSTTSAQRCYICKATPIEMNKIENVMNKEIDPTTLRFGLTTLHAWIRFFEYFLHVSYRLDIKKWQVKGEDKAKLLSRKKIIQEKFKNIMGLKVDYVRSGGEGTSNDGNTSRRFFDDPSRAAEITGIKKTLIIRCATILKAMSSGYEINEKAFSEYAMETAKLLVKEYPWYYMPASVHKILLHGSSVISAALLPIGQMSEEAQEARNKDLKTIRENNARKCSRIETNKDLLHGLLVSSDPLISSLRKLPPKKISSFSKEVLQLLTAVEPTNDFVENGSTFKLASFDENNEFESKKRKKHKKDKYEDKEKSGGLKLILKVGSGSCLPPTDEVISNGNHDAGDYLSKSHKKKKKKHKHHKEKRKRTRDDITLHEEISLGEETLAEAPISKRTIGLDNTTNKVTTNLNESQNGDWGGTDETTNPNENRQTLQQLLTHLLRALERRDPQQLFAWPVTDRIAPNYSRLISKPMDFETIRRNIQSNQYTSLNAFVADFKLMCDNAMTYNQPETIYYKAAKRLLHAGLKLTGPEKLKTLLSALPGMAQIPQAQLGFDINQDYQDTSNDTIIENNDRLHDIDQLNQRKILSKFEAIPDNLTPEEILKQAQNASKIASEKLLTKNTKMGFLKQQNNGSTSLSILVPNDGINPETGERPVLLGSLIGKLNHGVGSIPGFREDRRNMVKTVKPLYYGAFGSYAPTYDSTFANLTKEESDLVLRTYGDEASAQYAESILNFTKDSDYAMTMADNLLDLMTGGDHRKTKRVLDERKKQQLILEDSKKSIQSQQLSSCQSSVISQGNSGNSSTTIVNNQAKSAPIQIDQLKSLSELGIDTKFIDYYQEQSVFQDRLDHVGGLLGRLQNIQNQRLSAPLPQHLSQIQHPSPQEIQLADKITESLAENLKRVPPSAVMSVTGVRKAMGIAQISHLDVNQSNCNQPNVVNHGSSHQQTQVSLIGDGIQDRVEAVEGTVSGVDLESELREFLESDPTLTSFPLHDENDRTIEEILSES